MPTHEELARFLRQFDRLPAAVRGAFIDAVLALAGDLGDRGFDPTWFGPGSVRSCSSLVGLVRRVR